MDKKIKTLIKRHYLMTQRKRDAPLYSAEWRSVLKGKADPQWNVMSSKAKDEVVRRVLRKEQRQAG